MDLDQTTPDDITAILAPVERAAETVAVTCPNETVCAECAGAGEWEDVQVLAAEDLRYHHLITCPECGGTGAA